MPREYIEDNTIDLLSPTLIYYINEAYSTCIFISKELSLFNTNILNVNHLSQVSLTYLY